MREKFLTDWANLRNSPPSPVSSYERPHNDDRDYHYQVTGKQNWSEAVRVSRFVGGVLYMKSCPTKRDTSTFDYSLLKEFPASIAR